ncbi:MAG: hypothetical protein ABGZ17_04620, partial [Planctomycetaceae bacterium]
MQNSLWKLISIVGVVAIGILVVTEVQKELSGNAAPAQNTENLPSNDDQERVVTAPTEASEFERRLALSPPPEDEHEHDHEAAG